MDDLYREVIIEHYKNPSYRGKLDPHDISFADNNPLCGDHIQIDLRVGIDGLVTDARFDGHGCAISQASADLLLEKYPESGESVYEAAGFSRDAMKRAKRKVGAVAVKLGMDAGWVWRLAPTEGSGSRAEECEEGAQNSALPSLPSHESPHPSSRGNLPRTCGLVAEGGNNG